MLGIFVLPMQQVYHVTEAPHANSQPELGSNRMQSCMVNLEGGKRREGGGGGGGGFAYDVMSSSSSTLPLHHGWPVIQSSTAMESCLSTAPHGNRHCPKDAPCTPKHFTTQCYTGAEC